MEMDGEWMMKNATSKIDTYTVLDVVFKLDWKKKVKTKTKIISIFRTDLHLFSTCQALKAWFDGVNL